MIRIVIHLSNPVLPSTLVIPRIQFPPLLCLRFRYRLGESVPATASVESASALRRICDRLRRIRLRDRLRRIRLRDRLRRIRFRISGSGRDIISSLNTTGNEEMYERHCPEEGKGLNCIVPRRPKGYKIKIPWPQSRDEVWYNNVPHSRLVKDKGGQNWISRKNDKFIFHGASQYLDMISKMVPEIGFGTRTRVGLDIGCGIASFGAFLLGRNVITLSIAPKDVHENQIQFALERGVPAMLSVLATHRLPYTSQTFDFIHCSRCRINWTHDDGRSLLEVNRLLRAGGYFIWAAQPVYKHEENLMEQ